METQDTKGDGMSLTCIRADNLDDALKMLDQHFVSSTVCTSATGVLGNINPAKPLDLQLDAIDGLDNEFVSLLQNHGISSLEQAMELSVAQMHQIPEMRMEYIDQFSALLESMGKKSLKLRDFDD